MKTKPKSKTVFVVVNKRGRPCTGNFMQGLQMPIAEYRRFLDPIDRWAASGAHSIVKMRLVPFK